jgi:hypothetical protein
MCARLEQGLKKKIQLMVMKRFQIFFTAYQTEQIFKFFSKDVTLDRKLSCSRTHRKFKKCKLDVFRQSNH